MLKLNQIIAIEKSVKNRVHNKITQLYHIIQKNELFNGFVKTYNPKDDEGEVYPSEIKRVQNNTKNIIEDFFCSISELIDISATKDYANCKAGSDVEVDGIVILNNVPTHYLLFLEKQIINMRTFINTLPVLDDDEKWQFDKNKNIYITDSIKTHKTKKVSKPIVLYEATDKHPAQTELINDDITVGYWNTIKESSCISYTDKQSILNRIDKLYNSVKFARENANTLVISKIELSKKIINYILNKENN